MRPRCDRFTQLLDFSLSIIPTPEGISDYIDLDGNNLIKLWFSKATQELSIHTITKVETSCTNPFNYLLEPWAISLPFDCPSSLARQLQPYLKPYGVAIDPVAVELAQKLLLETSNNTLDFLFALNQRIYKDCVYIIRETGAPFPPGITWRNRQGSCRDYAVLSMPILRHTSINNTA